MNDFADFLPNPAALKTLDALIACGVSLGKISDKYNVLGHRQARNTACPGESFYDYVKTLPGWTSKPMPIRSAITNGITSTDSTMQNSIPGDTPNFTHHTNDSFEWSLADC